MNEEEEKRMEFLRHNVVELRKAVEELAEELGRAHLALKVQEEIGATLQKAADLLLATTKNLTEERDGLYATLAQKEQDLLTYKDYYGTSLAQVRHLQGCARCYLPGGCGEWRCSGNYCPDYPSE